MQNKFLYKKLFFSKLCFHFYIFDEIITSNSDFFTNYNQIVNGVCIESTKDGSNINFDYLYHYSLSDMLSYDDYKLFSVFETIYQ